MPLPPKKKKHINARTEGFPFVEGGEGNAKQLKGKCRGTARKKKRAGRKRGFYQGGKRGPSSSCSRGGTQYTWLKSSPVLGRGEGGGDDLPKPFQRTSQGKKESGNVRRGKQKFR